MVFEEEYIVKLYTLLEPCREVIGDETWHPEGSVWIHSFQALHHALRESDNTDAILAAFMHDVGKQVHSLGHEKESVKLLNDLLSPKSLWLVEQHMRFWLLVQGEMRQHKKVRFMLDHPWLAELCLVARWDKMARKKNYYPYINATDLTKILNEKAALHFGGDHFDSDRLRTDR